MAGLVLNNRHSLRQEAPANDDEPITIDDADEGAPKTDEDDDGKVISIEFSDGSVQISTDGKSLIDDEEEETESGWFGNLVHKIEQTELYRISDELLRGIDNDIESRREWIEDRTNGIKLLGLKIEMPGIGGSADGAPVEGMSKVRHPLLLEAVLRFQANTRAEMLPVGGPAKIRNDDNNPSLAEDGLADAYEKDFNHYLTVTASEYYPDTDRMFLMLGFGGSTFKKIYFCPLRNRPVSETVSADDLIVSNQATDLKNARRVTHRSMQRPSTIKRLQLLGVYKDMALGDPKPTDIDDLQREKMAQQGIAPDIMNPDDRDREIYECDCELNIKGHEHKYEGKLSGLEIPYTVTLDVSSREILAIRRNYNEDEELPMARQKYVKYAYIPGFGFYDIGLLHILGNTTNAITAAWRELLDAGMFSNFPGFLFADVGGRQNTNLFRVPPGGGAMIKTGGMPISNAIMPLPYKEPSTALMQLTENMAETGMRVGGTAEQPVGEGRADAPVGTTLATIEQAQKIISGVHKRTHSSQAEELQLLAACFRDHPKSFWQQRKRPAWKWDEDTFRQALEDYDLVPQSDPNTASQLQRLMRVVALKQAQAGAPDQYDPRAVEEIVVRTLGFSAQEVLSKNPGQPSPQLLKGMNDAQNETKKADAAMLTAQSRAEEVKTRGALDQQKTQTTTQIDQAKLGLQKDKVDSDKQHNEAQLADDRQARLFKERIDLVDAAQNIAVHPMSAGLVEPLIRPAMQDLEANQQSSGLVGNRP